MRDVILRMQDVEVTAVCDEYKDRVQAASKLAEEAGGKPPLAAVDVQEVLDSPLVDAVVIASAWESHIPIAVRAMHAGKAVGMEVGGCLLYTSYKDALEVMPYFKYLTNTLIIVLSNVGGSVLSASLCAFSFSRMRWPGRDKIFMAILTALMMPCLLYTSRCV